MKDYYTMQKFNVMEIANTKNAEKAFKEREGRVEKEIDSIGKFSVDTAEE